MKTSSLVFICLFLIVFTVGAPADDLRKRSSAAIPPNIHARIIQLEDERNLGGDELLGLLKHQTPDARQRAALAIGRIGDKRGTEPLINTLRRDEDAWVRAMAAFALGEIEDVQAADALLDVVNSPRGPLFVKARAVEALGKIAGVQANAEKLGQTTLDSINQSLVNRLPAADAKPLDDRKLFSSLTITALMRLRNPASVEPLTQQLKSKDADFRARAANALARLRQPIDSAVPALIEALNDGDADVRANAARALGASKNARAVEPLIKLLNDKNDWVQVGAIRALVAINDRRAVEPLIVFGDKVNKQVKPVTHERSARLNMLLEITTAFGAFKDPRALWLLNSVRRKLWSDIYPEAEIAIARIDWMEFSNWESDSSLTAATREWPPNLAHIQGLAEMDSDFARSGLSALWNKVSREPVKDRWVSETLRVLAKLKHEGTPQILRRQLSTKDVIVRSTAATLLADYSSEENLNALVQALANEKTDTANDARLAILTALSKYRSEKAIESVKAALNDPDHLVRRRAIDLLKQMGAGDFSDRIGIVQTGHDKGFYQQVAARLNKKVTATIHTDKGLIKIELFPQDAPITVDSFITLARKGYFNNLTFHRVVPNFVIQGGDPRGDGEGGPGYQIRCEINTRPYARGAIGMALSGKDTGGSQFFITHSPQPHLDGGYTVFGQVVSGMDVVDRIPRGDLIRKVEIFEGR